MKNLTKEDLMDIIRILADFRDRHLEKATRGGKSEGVQARNLAWSKNADRLIGLVTAEMKEME